MLVNGRDHDMMILTDMFTLRQNLAGRNSAWQLARMEDLNRHTLTAQEAVTLLNGAGEVALCFEGDQETTLMLAKGYAARGCATMIQVAMPHGADGRMWHLMVDPREGMIATLCHQEEVGPPEIMGRIEDFFKGAVVVIVERVPGWDGSWDRLWEKYRPT